MSAPLGDTLEYGRKINKCCVNNWCQKKKKKKNNKVFSRASMHQFQDHPCFYNADSLRFIFDVLWMDMEARLFKIDLRLLKKEKLY